MRSWEVICFCPSVTTAAADVRAAGPEALAGVAAVAALTVAAPPETSEAALPFCGTAAGSWLLVGPPGVSGWPFFGSTEEGAGFSDSEATGLAGASSSVLPLAGVGMGLSDWVTGSAGVGTTSGVAGAALGRSPRGSGAMSAGSADTGACVPSAFGADFLENMPSSAAEKQTGGRSQARRP
jgi:hypothetical protein